MKQICITYKTFEDNITFFVVFMERPGPLSPSPPSCPPNESPLPKRLSKNFFLINWVNHLDQRKSLSQIFVIFSSHFNVCGGGNVTLVSVQGGGPVGLK